MIFFKNLLTMLFVFSPLVAHAQWDLFYESEQTSDSVTRKSTYLQYQQKRQNLNWAYADEPKRGEKIFGIKALANNLEHNSRNAYDAGLSLSYGVRLSENTHLVGSIGFLNLRSDGNSNKSLLVPELMYDWKVSESFFASFYYKRGFVFQDLLIGLNQFEAIEADTLGVNILSRGDYWRLPIRVNERWLSDGNRRMDADVEIKFRLDEEKDWVWVGVGGSYTAASRSADYWSPIRATTLGPRFEFSIKLREPDFSIFGEIDAYAINEDSIYNNGYSGRIGLLKGDRNESQFKLSGFIIDSTQNGGGWRSEGFTLQLMF